jgi:hypothetical protein
MNILYICEKINTNMFIFDNYIKNIDKYNINAIDIFSYEKMSILKYKKNMTIINKYLKNKLIKFKYINKIKNINNTYDYIINNKTNINYLSEYTKNSTIININDINKVYINLLYYNNIEADNKIDYILNDYKSNIYLKKYYYIICDNNEDINLLNDMINKNNNLDIKIIHRNNYLLELYINKYIKYYDSILEPNIIVYDNLNRNKVNLYDYINNKISGLKILHVTNKDISELYEKIKNNPNHLMIIYNINNNINSDINNKLLLNIDNYDLIFYDEEIDLKSLLNTDYLNNNIINNRKFIIYDKENMDKLLNIENLKVLDIEIDSFESLLKVNKDKLLEIIDNICNINNNYKYNDYNNYLNYIQYKNNEKPVIIDKIYNNYVMNKNKYTKELDNIKIVCVMCAYKRELLLDNILNYMCKTDIFKIIVVGSNKLEKNVVDKHNKCEFVYHTNLPLSNKWHKAILESKKYNPDGVLILGSDDIVTNEYIRYCKYLLFNNYDFIGCRAWFTTLIKNNKVLEIAFKGYNKNRTENEPIGAGRVISNKCLNLVEWNLYKFNIPLNRVLDYNSYNIILKHKNKLRFKIIYPTNDIHILCIKDTRYENISVTYGKYYNNSKEGSSWYKGHQMTKSVNKNNIIKQFTDYYIQKQMNGAKIRNNFHYNNLSSINEFIELIN